MTANGSTLLEGNFNEVGGIQLDGSFYTIEGENDKRYVELILQKDVIGHESWEDLFEKEKVDKTITNYVVMTITIDAEDAGNLLFGLYGKQTPKTVENFRQLCINEGQDYKFAGSFFHRIIKGFVCQGGDITDGDGYGGMSIYGKTFEDENFGVKHTQRGQLSMANCGPNTNNSQFFITLKNLPSLNDKHVVFGELIEGFETLQLIEEEGTRNGAPRRQVQVTECDEVGIDQIEPFREYLKEIWTELQIKKRRSGVAETVQYMKQKKQEEFLKNEARDREVEKQITKLRQMQDEKQTEARKNQEEQRKQYQSSPEPHKQDWGYFNQRLSERDKSKQTDLEKQLDMLQNRAQRQREEDQKQWELEKQQRIISQQEKQKSYTAFQQSYQELLEKQRQERRQPSNTQGYKSRFKSTNRSITKQPQEQNNSQSQLQENNQAQQQNQQQQQTNDQNKQQQSEHFDKQIQKEDQEQSQKPPTQESAISPELEKTLREKIRLNPITDEKVQKVFEQGKKLGYLDHLQQ